MRSMSVLALCIAAVPLHAQPFKMEPAAKSPQDSLKCIQVRPGFKVELMVAEPLVKSPIAFAWGPDGKFWVVEMGDYPMGIDGKGKPGGKIKYLEKTKPDGPYDKMTVFMDGLPFPTGVFPYAKGILVTCAPDIFYAEVGPDGKLAKKTVLFTGFKEGNQQHRVNGLTWGIDNWIYGANGDSGGIVKSLKTGKEVNISGRDFRFKPDTGEFETVSGQSQFGRCRDDWGNWFGCNNSNPMYHFVLEDRYLKRNPYVLYPDVKVTVPIIPGAQPVYPISKPLPRFNNPQSVNHFTSACSTIIYRDNLFGKDFEGNMFVSEPVHNLVHREIVKPKGVTFTSQRANDEKTSEFLASSDNWFRPAMIQVGPDGALWIADMYRYVIEHPQWIPKDWQKKLDLRAGQDKGRIYRVYPADKKLREFVRLDKMKGEELVKQLESPSGWVRDTAQQLLINWFSLNRALPSDLRESVISKSSVPQARLHAAYIYNATFTLPRQTLKYMMRDQHPAVRKHAITLMEDYLLNADTALPALAKDRNEQVRQQLAYSLGIKSEFVPDELLPSLMLKNASNPHILAAALSSVNNRNWKATLDEIMMSGSIPTPLAAPLLRLAKALGEPVDVAKIFVRMVAMQESGPNMKQLRQVADMMESLRANHTTIQDILRSTSGSEIDKSKERLRAMHDFALDIATNPKELPRDRSAAVRVLYRGLANDRADQKTLAGLLTPRTPDEVQAAAIEQLAKSEDARVPGMLLARWKSLSPALRNQTMDAVLSRPLWTALMVEAIKTKQVPAQEIDAVRRQRLLQHKNPAVRDASAKIFAAASNKDRGTVIDLYWLQMPAKANAMRGAKLFAKSCATCHKLGGVGQNVGPDLASVGDKSVQGLLTAILDPNRAVESRYINYLATTKAGLTYNGILSAETSTSITLISADGKTHQLLRNELEELASTGKSLMPDDLEKDLAPRDLADVIEYVRTVQPALKNR